MIFLIVANSCQEKCLRSCRIRQVNLEYLEQLRRLGAHELGKFGEKELLLYLIRSCRTRVGEGLSVRVELLASQLAELEGLARGEALDRRKCSRQDNLEGFSIKRTLWKMSRLLHNQLTVFIVELCSVLGSW